jgi:hypothetical protein
MIEYGLEACSLQKCHSGILIIAAMSRVQNLIDESIGRALYILIVKIVHANSSNLISSSKKILMMPSFLIFIKSHVLGWFSFSLFFNVCTLSSVLHFPVRQQLAKAVKTMRCTLDVGHWSNVRCGNNNDTNSHSHRCVLLIWSAELASHAPISQSPFEM